MRPLLIELAQEAVEAILLLQAVERLADGSCLRGASANARAAEIVVGDEPFSALRCAQRPIGRGRPSMIASIEKYDVTVSSSVLLMIVW